jgi:hypothetical protein
MRPSGRPQPGHVVGRVARSERRHFFDGTPVVSGDRSNEMGKSSTSFAFTPIPPARGNLRPPIMSALAGVWRGHLMAADDDVSIPFTLIRDASVDASVVGRFLFFMTKDVPPTGVKLLEASQSTFVAMVGPYFDPRENADVVTVFEGRRVDNKISGKFNTRLVRGYRQVRAGRFVAVRAEAGSTV